MFINLYRILRKVSLRINCAIKKTRVRARRIEKIWRNMKQGIEWKENVKTVRLLGKIGE